MLDLRRIIIVDDEPDLLLSVSALVQRRFPDAEVLSMPDGESALRAAEEGCDLMISDYAMPGMDGEALVAAIRSRFPSVPIVIMSGFADAALRDRLVRTRRVVFLEKPFRFAELEAAVDRASCQR